MRACATRVGSVRLTGIWVVNVVLETGVLTKERQARGPDGAITLLGNDDFGGPLVCRVLVVYLVTVDEDNQVCILLNRSRIMADYAIRKPRSRTRNGKVIDIFYAVCLDSNDLIPKEFGFCPDVE